MAQSAKNHLRFYPLHHFIAAPLSLIIFVYALGKLFTDFNIPNLIFSLAGLLLVLSPLLSRLYGLKNQDRIIRLEMRQRYFELTGKRFSPLEKQLALKQIIALRFASDDELLCLIDQAIENKLSPKQIKEKIQHWQADNHRV
jgi:hypothetical protein